MNDKPFFSIVVPLYNRAFALRRLLKCVNEQEFEDYELIIIDDGSTDDPSSILNEIVDSRIRYFKQLNAGGSAARNTGIMRARGKYIAFLDSDDLFKGCHLKNNYELLREKGFPDDVCLYCQVIVDRGNGLSFLKPNRAITVNEQVADYLLKNRGFIQTSTLVVPANIISKVSFNTKLRYGQDTDFAISLSLNGYHFEMLGEPSVVWVDHWADNRVSNNNFPEERLCWLNSLQPNISSEAYYSDLGWQVARGFSHTGKFWKGFGLYLKALLNGVYYPKLAIVVFLQVVLSKRHYRILSDQLAKFGFKP